MLAPGRSAGLAFTVPLGADAVSVTRWHHGTSGKGPHLDLADSRASASRLWRLHAAGASSPAPRIVTSAGSAGIGRNAVDIELQAQDLRNTRDTVLGLIAEHTGQPLERVVQDSQRDRWFSAEQSLRYGFVDEVLDSLDRVRPVRRTPVGLTVRAEP